MAQKMKMQADEIARLSERCRTGHFCGSAGTRSVPMRITLLQQSMAEAIRNAFSGFQWQLRA
jgi:hypothetical protein